MPENAVVFPVTKFGHFIFYPDLVREGYHLNGTGKLKESGTREGLFIDGKLYNGTSTNFSPLFGFQGNTYTGPVVDGRYSGHGKYTRYFHALQFVVYEGDFVRGMMHGKGRYEYVQKGYFQKGKFVHLLGRIIYVGDFADDQFHGIGTLSSLEKITTTLNAMERLQWACPTGKEKCRGKEELFYMRESLLQCL